MLVLLMLSYLGYLPALLLKMDCAAAVLLNVLYS
jgi:hypothetical protein